ncbi:hypothetical protein CS0771_52230 [Catellatospora sp. IY07-71]|nr:hypothetical protein CS0771_52230 [Catellatospora sp. IY07-71]
MSGRAPKLRISAVDTLRGPDHIATRVTIAASSRPHPVSVAQRTHRPGPAWPPHPREAQRRLG